MSTTHEIEFHPVANLFPLMDESELAELAEDIKANGLQQPIELLDGMIVDGRHRYRACDIAGVEPAFVNVEVDDPIAYVLSRNLHRRHLTPSQRAMIAVDVQEYYEGEAKQRENAGRGANGSGGRGRKKNPEEMLPQGLRAPQARDQAGTAVGVSGRTVGKAAKVRREGTPELVKAVEDGTVTVTAAVKQIEAKPKKQKRPKDGDGRHIPKHLIDVFATEQDFKDFAQMLSTLKGQVKKAIAANPVAWSRFSENAFRAAISNLRSQFKLNGPFIVCSYCGGAEDNTCIGCKGSGFLTRAQARCVPKEMRP